MCVVAGLKGAPSGPMNRTFFFSPSEGDVGPVGVIGRAVEAADGPLRSKCFSPSSDSARPGVATVDQAPLPEDWLREGVRADAVSMVGRLAFFGGVGDRSVGVEPEDEVARTAGREMLEKDPRSSRADPCAEGSLVGSDGNGSTS